jgi:hypothetical protein
MTLHQIVAESRHASCATCCAAEDQLCTCGPRGVHYSRVARACQGGYITLTDFGEAIHDDVFTGGDVLVDPGEVAA